MFLPEALSLHRQGRLSEAAALCRQLVTQNPRDAGVLNLLGVFELQQGRLRAAIEWIDRAIATEPGNPAFHCNRGVALQDLQRFEEAVASYERALAIRPDLVEVLNNRGTVLRVLKHYAEALASYDQALTIHPDYAEAHNNRANCLRDLQRPEEACTAYTRALAIKPDYVEACRNHADVLRELGRLEESLAAFDRLLVLAPNDPTAHNGLANILALQEKFDAAIAQYERAISIRADYFEAHVNLAGVLSGLRRFADAAEHYRLASKIMPKCAEAFVRLGEALLELGRSQEALAACEAAESVAAADEIFPHFSLGVLLARCGCRDPAREQIRRYLKQHPEDPEGGQMILAALGFGPVPERLSDAHLRRLYDVRAGRWTGTHGYHGHELIAGAVARLVIREAAMDVLDAGCGTGLAGEKLRRYARRLHGVDLSTAMLAQTHAKHVYDSLHQADLIEFLAARADAYDLIVSAATLIHFGELTPVFAAAAHALRADGLFVFTVFPNDREQETGGVAVAPLGGLGEGGCFVHGRDYLSRAAAATGFSVALMEPGVHECDNQGAPVTGLIVALRRGEPGTAI